jgi:hypothetical protein
VAKDSVEHDERDTVFGAGSGGLLSALLVGLIGALMPTPILPAFIGRRALVAGTENRGARSHAPVLCTR